MPHYIVRRHVAVTPRNIATVQRPFIGTVWASNRRDADFKARLKFHLALRTGLVFELEQGWKAKLRAPGAWCPLMNPRVL